MHGFSVMRFMFWLSRASAPCGGIRTTLQMTHSCVTLHFRCTHFSILRIPEAHKAYLRGFLLSTQSKETTSARWLPFFARFEAIQKGVTNQKRIENYWFAERFLWLNVCRIRSWSGSQAQRCRLALPLDSPTMVRDTSGVTASALNDLKRLRANVGVTETGAALSAGGTSLSGRAAVRRLSRRRREDRCHHRKGDGRRDSNPLHDIAS